MNINYKIGFVSILIFVLSQNLFSAEVGAREIEPNSYYIQVGAYKKSSSIREAKKLLYKYDYYLEPYKNLFRIKVVNIKTKRKLKQALRDLRRNFPKAFVTKSIKRVITAQKIIKKEYGTTTKSFENFAPKEKNTQSLDSNTILKTRKSFL